MKKTLYLCGPMTGMPEFNRPAFHQAANALRAAGYNVLNPAENKRPEHHTWQSFMRDSIALMVQADAVATLPNWQASRGARLELELAGNLSIPVRNHKTWLFAAAAQAAHPKASR